MRNQLETALNTIFSARQTNRLLRLSFPKNDGPKALMVANRLDAAESLSRDFHFNVEVISNDATIPLKDMQGKMVTVELIREDGSQRFFNGYVFEFRLIKADGGQVYYDMVLLPWLAYARLKRDNFLFHGRTLLDQTEDIFGDYPVRDSELRITNDPAFTDAMQYDESDYNYLHRRWEQQGWYYWYEHRADGHTLILSDDSTQAAPIDGYKAEIPFQRAAGAQEDDGIGDWTPVRRIVPGSVSLSSFDFKNPRANHVALPTNNQQGEVLDLEVYEYSGSFGFKNAADGNDQSRLRMEEIEAAGKHFEASGNDRSAQPGRWFKLTNHFDTEVLGSDENADTFLILEVRHSASNNYQTDGGMPAHYSNHLSCIRKIIPYRPGRGHNSAEPKIYGLQTALVTGPAGEEIHTDDYGRVRVQFHWDRAGSYDEKSSAWIRVATAWSGPSFGMTSIPRVGTEVIVQFLDGNPDRPLITGMVPNAATKPAWELPANKTQSGILSRSSPGGSYSNANALRFEDKMGQEQLWLHAEKDQLTEVEHDEDKWVGNDRRKTIDRDETNHIKRDRTETVDRDETITVHGKRTESVDGNETITIHSNRTERVDLNEKISIGGERNEDVGQGESIRIANSRDLNIGDSHHVKVGKIKTETIGMAAMETVGMGKMLNVGLGYDINVGMVMMTIVGMNRIDKIGQTLSVSAGEKIEFVCGGSKIVLTPDAIYLDAKDIHLKAGSHVHIDGPKDVLLNSGTAQAAPGDKAPAPPPAAPDSGGASSLGGMLSSAGKLAATAGKVAGLAASVGLGGKDMGMAAQMLGGIGGLAAGGGGVAATVAGSEANSAPSEEAGGVEETEETEDAEESGEEEAPTMKERVKNLEVLKNVTPAAKDLISKSPTLVEAMEAHQSRWNTGITKGESGKGSGFDADDGSLTIDPEQTPDANSYVKILAHESGHFSQRSCDLPPYTDSENSFVNCRVDAEGTAVLQNIKIQREIIANGGSDIGINGSFPQVYNQIFDQQQAGLISQSEAEARIGSIIGQFEHSSLAPELTPDRLSRERFQKKYGAH